MGRPLKLYFVRHGQTDLNRDRRFRGLTDVPLNDEGRAQAAGAARILSGLLLGSVISSPIPRAVETARIISLSAGCPVVTDDGFTDIDYGEWQGLTVEEVETRFGPEAIESWKRNPGGFSFPGGDSMVSVRDRLDSSIERIAAEHDGSVAVVSHLAVIKVCFLVVMGLPFEYFWNLGLENGSVSLFTRARGGGFVLEWWNQVVQPSEP
jgi:broad specificity phosphatase PhoE